MTIPLVAFHLKAQQGDRSKFRDNEKKFEYFKIK